MKKSQLRHIIKEVIKEQTIPYPTGGPVSPIRNDNACCEIIQQLMGNVDNTMLSRVYRPPRKLYDDVINDFRYILGKMDCGPFN